MLAPVDKKFLKLMVKKLRRRPLKVEKKKWVTLLDLCVSSLRRGHANLLCIVPILTDGNPEGNPTKESFLRVVQGAQR